MVIHLNRQRLWMLVVACCLCGIAASATSRAGDFVPNYDQSKVPDYSLPDVLAGPKVDGEKGGASASGERAETPEQWREVRRETLSAFESHVYGRMPAWRHITATRVAGPRPRTVDDAQSGVEGEEDSAAMRSEWDVTIRSDAEAAESAGLTMHVLVDVPAGASAKDPVPAFVGLNFHGNHAVTSDPAVRLPNSWVRDRGRSVTDGNQPSERGRGYAADRWPIDRINDRGYAMVTVYYGDIDPDYDDGAENGIHGLLADWIATVPEAEQPGSIAGWAYGLSCVLDFLQQHEELGIDSERVAVIGHSRLGKTALWAGATDPRFAMVVSNESGCGGAALSRRAYGETIKRINTQFPHWFAKRFHEYGDNESDCPVDQHQLIALLAPRPLAVGSAEGDRWADPKGEFLSAVHASPVYRLLGEPGLQNPAGSPATQTQWPSPGEALQSGTISYHLRPGPHDLTGHDWNRYLDFADRLLK